MWYDHKLGGKQAHRATYSPVYGLTAVVGVWLRDQRKKQRSAPPYPVGQVAWGTLFNETCI